MDEQQELTIKHLIDQYLLEQIQQLLKTEQKVENKASFIFLDNQTITMIMMYLFSRSDNQKSSKTSAVKKEDPDFDRLIEENRSVFEEIIQQLKDKNNA
ncbi:hypothetical protein KGF86_13530 [Ornithinibacillus massiliensis]|uniref:Uncharacterized protein n=1 Tax=Ornithinibacillus massiliensis TaxID=1944633 RepID=A0ABS5MFV9_9BACI|nr:hypothetical protein [Ornithinibacillus massiliensis]MBS3681224.1 hypothetical protein [Ornithinibacillus massiliensis]